MASQTLSVTVPAAPTSRATPAHAAPARPLPPSANTRRAWLRGALGVPATATGLALAACGAGGRAATPPAPGSIPPATVSFATLGDEFYKNAPSDTFKQRYPSLTVEHTVLGAGPVYLEKILGLLVAGTPPDVWDVGQGTINEFEKRGEALVLDPLIARDTWIDFADFEPSSRYHMGGKRHMLPRDTGVSCIYYNADHWQRTGLGNPRQLWLDKKWDWNAFLDAARRLTADSPDGRRYGFGLLGTAPWAIGPWLWQNGIDYAEWNTNKQTIDRPAAIESLQWIVDLSQRHRVMPTPDANRSEMPTFANGRVSMVMDFSFNRGTYSRMQNVKWDVAPLPRGAKATAVHVARNGFSISTKSKVRDAAWLWLAHITGKDVTMLATQEGRVHPPRKSAASSDAFLKRAGVTADLRPFVDQQPFGQFGAPHEKRGELNTLLGQQVPPALNGQISAQALATQMAPMIQQILDQGKDFADPVKK